MKNRSNPDENEQVSGDNNLTSIGTISPSQSPTLPPTFIDDNDPQTIQRSALQSLFLDLRGDQWYEIQGWLEIENDGPIEEEDPSSSSAAGISYCNWFGIECNDDGDVESIELWFNNLSGTITTEVGQLKSLKKLNLSNNIITGALPSELGLLSKLTKVKLNGNSLTSSVPTSLVQLTSLSEIYLGQNDLTGTLPMELGVYPSLIRFQLHYNRFKGTIPSEYGNLIKLHDFSLKQNSLTGTIPSELGRLLVAESMTFGENSLEGTMPEELCEISIRNGGILKINVDSSVVCDCCSTSCCRQTLNR